MKWIALLAPGRKGGTYQGFFAGFFSFGSIFAYLLIPMIGDAWLAVGLYPTRWDELLSVGDTIQASRDPYSARFRVVLYSTGLLDQGRMGAGVSSRTLLRIFDQPG